MLKVWLEGSGVAICGLAIAFLSLLYCSHNWCCFSQGRKPVLAEIPYAEALMRRTLLVVGGVECPLGIWWRVLKLKLSSKGSRGGWKLVENARFAFRCLWDFANWNAARMDTTVRFAVTVTPLSQHYWALQRSTGPAPRWLGRTLVGTMSPYLRPMLPQGSFSRNPLISTRSQIFVPLQKMFREFTFPMASSRIGTTQAQASFTSTGPSL